MTARPPTSTAPPSETLPHGLTDVDYEAIEAAVTETVRGRWFLKEFARRNRGAEVKLMLDAMARLETMVSADPAHTAIGPPPSADPSIRLLLQRIKDIAADLDTVARDMRDDGIEPHFWESVEMQARAVAGLMRTGTMAEPRPARLDRPSAAPPQEHAAVAHAPIRLLSEPPSGSVTESPPSPSADSAQDPRLAVLSRLDRLPLAKKLALFT